MEENPENRYWYALYTKSRTEKKLAERLQRKGFEVYAPTQTVYRQWSDRKKKVQEPLFKSYVFIKFDLRLREEVLQTPGAVAVVYWLRKPAIIRQEEIDAIKEFLEDYENIEVENISFEPGEALRVKVGGLQDKEGIVIRQSRHRVTLQLSQLGMVLTAEVPKSQVEKASAQSSGKGI